MLEIPDDQPCARLISFGHLPPLLLHGGHVTPLEVSVPAPPLGLGALTETEYAPLTFRFAQGDRLVLYTDGVTEARDCMGSFYPLVERVTAWADQRPDALVRRIGADLRAYTGGPLADDMALIVLQHEGARGRARISENRWDSSRRRGPLEEKTRRRRARASPAGCSLPGAAKRADAGRAAQSCSRRSTRRSDDELRLDGNVQVLRSVSVRWSCLARCEWR